MIEWDDGVASERTVLAWERTAISTLAVAVLILRAGIVIGPLTIAAPVGTLLAGAAGFEWYVRRRLYLEHDRPMVEGAILHERLIVILATITLAAAAAALVLSVGV
jgi:uncharacterized membrane protein YidH (DUF202 family)